MGTQLNEEAAEFIKTNSLHKYTRDSDCQSDRGWRRGLAKPAVLESEPPLGSKYNPQDARGHLLPGRVEKLHLLEEMVLSGLTLEGKDESKTTGVILPLLNVDCQDDVFVMLWFIWEESYFVNQVLASKQYLTLCHVCGHRPAEDGPVKVLEGGTKLARSVSYYALTLAPCSCPRGLPNFCFCGLLSLTHFCFLGTGTIGHPLASVSAGAEASSSQAPLSLTLCLS